MLKYFTNKKNMYFLEILILTVHAYIHACIYLHMDIYVHIIYYYYCTANYQKSKVIINHML